MDFANEIIIDYRVLAMDLFQLFMVSISLFMAYPEFRRNRLPEYIYLMSGLMFLTAHFLIRVYFGASYELLQILYIPAVEFLGSFLESIGLVLIAYFFSTGIMRDTRMPLRWGRVMMLGIIGLSILTILLGLLGLFETDSAWVLLGRPAFRMAVLLVILVAITQYSNAETKPTRAIAAFVSLAIAHLYHLLYYSSGAQTGFMAFIFPWPYIFNPIGYFLVVTAIFSNITDEQMLLTQQLKRRTTELQTAKSNLTRLNQLSTNLLRTTELKGIIRMILDSLSLDLGFRNTALFILEKESATLRGYKISQLTGSPVSYPQISISENSFVSRCFLDSKPLFFSESINPANSAFLRDFDFSARIAIIPLLTKKEVECYELHSCKNKNCPVQSLDLNICWMMDERECPCGKIGSNEKILKCLNCPSFNLAGMIVIDNRSSKVKADENIMSFLETFANHAGMALQNAYLVENLSKESILRTATLKNLPVGVIVLGIKGEIREFNYAMSQISGLSEDETIGKHYENVRIVDDTGKYHEQVRNFLDSMSTMITDEMLSHTLNVGGVSKILNVRMRPILRNQRFNGLIIMVEDITSMKELERQLIRSESLANMGQLAMGIAHEINNPLAGVSGVLQVLEKKFDGDSSERKALSTAQKDLKRASGIIKDLLNFAKPNQPDKKLVDLNSILNESVDFIPYQPGGGNITLLKDMDEKLPLVNVDPDQIHQVITNLILNSISALRNKSGSEATMKFTTWFDNNHVYIQIEDNGTGIPPDKLNKIFDPFFTTKGSGKGTGLGLSFCDRIINDHGGIISVRSEPDKGASFILKIPRRSSS